MGVGVWEDVVFFFWLWARRWWPGEDMMLQRMQDEFVLRLMFEEGVEY